MSDTEIKKFAIRLLKNLFRFAWAFWLCFCTAYILGTLTKILYMAFIRGWRVIS